MSGDVLAMVRVMRHNLAQPQHPMPSREDLLSDLGRIEAALGDIPRHRQDSKSAATLAALVALGGCTPMQLGERLDPARRGNKAGVLGSVRLSALRAAGHARKVCFGWWEPTEAGRAEAARLRAEPALDASAEEAGRHG